jgi:predicted CXXCH cytochrome family protein
MNALVAPGDELCFRCHDLRLDKPYVHGPLASGGCLVCHDPHRSRYRALLVSASDGFCFHCHEASSLQPIRGHESGGERCTACHDAHMSDRPHLLK